MKLKLLDKLIMLSKLSLYGLVIQCFMLSSIWAEDTSAQKIQSVNDVMVDLGYTRAKLEKVFKLLENQTDFYFSYSKEDIDPTLDFSFEKKLSIPVRDVLLEISKKSGLKFRQVNNNISVFGSNSEQALAIEIELPADIEISGKIIDENGEGLPGASIIEKGTSNGTTTDLNGGYKLKMSENATLVISFVGYKTVETLVAGRSTIDLQMELDSEQLEEIVIVGYGTVKKSDLTGAVSSLRKENMNTGVTSSIDDLLQGKIAGVQITQASAEPGGGITIQIRGSSSINAGSSPLYVIDGLPIDNSNLNSQSGANVVNSRTPRNPLSSINPTDIESIEILKDASAAAIYGARGANGVIIVKTKSGSAGKMNITYSGYRGVQKSFGRMEVLNAQDYQTVLNEILDTPGSGVSEGERVVDIIEGGTDWQKELDQTATVQSHSLSFTGGSSKTKYFASMNYFDQEGVMINSAFKRYDTRLNLDHKIDDFHFGANILTSVTHDNFAPIGFGTNESSGTLYAALNFDPTLSIFNDEGRYMISSLINTDNPLAIANGKISTAENHRTLGTLFGEYTILPGWTAKITIGFDTKNSHREAYVSTDTKDGLAAGGIASILTQSRNNYLTEFITTYSKEINEEHRFTVVGGTTYEKFNNHRFAGTGQGFPTDQTLTNNIGLSNPELNTLSSFKENNKLVSFIGRLNYSVKNKYLFTATFRADGSSRFGENNKFAYFPSAAFAWKIHEEQFIQDLNVFSSLKLRASVGRTGNQAIGNYRSITTYGPGKGVVLGGARIVSLEPERIANPNLKWETTEQVNIGFDYGFLEDRIYASMDYFEKRTYDMLFALPIPSSTGYASILQNIGDIKNQGFELMVNSKNLDGQFSWSTNLNFSTLKNTVTNLGPIPEVIHTGAGWTSNIAIIREGVTLNSFYGYKTAGIWQTQEEITESGTTDLVKPGDIKYVDQNGDKTVNSDDRVVLGNSMPDYSFGFTNTFGYKGFSLNVFIDGIMGIEMLNNATVETYFPISHRRNRLANPILNRWTEDNPSFEYPSFVNPNNQGSKGVSDISVEDASYVRLRSIKLNYNVPLKHQKLFSKINIYASGQNLGFLTNYSGVDPTSNSNGNASLKIDFNSYPVSRTFIMGIEIVL